MVATTVNTTGVAVSTAPHMLFFSGGSCSDVDCGEANGGVMEGIPFKLHATNHGEVFGFIIFFFRPIHNHFLSARGADLATISRPFLSARKPGDLGDLGDPSFHLRLPAPVSAI